MKNIFEEKSPKEIEAMVFEYLVRKNPNLEFLTADEVPENKETTFYSGSGNYSYRIRIRGNIHPCKLKIPIGEYPSYEINFEQVYDSQLPCWRHAEYNGDNIIIGEIDSCWSSDGY